jgi:hypothetical protein
MSGREESSNPREADHTARTDSDISATWAVLNSETHRGCVLVGAEWLNDELAFLLRTKFRAEGIDESTQKNF